MKTNHERNDTEAERADNVGWEDGFEGRMNRSQMFHHGYKNAYRRGRTAGRKAHVDFMGANPPRLGF